MTIYQCILTVCLFLFNCLFVSPVIQADTVVADKKIDVINIEITTHLGNQQTFVEGDDLSFLFNLDRDAYLLAIYQDAEGNLIQLLPNRESSSLPQKAGMFIPLPKQNAKFRFKIQAPFGKEELWIFASDQLPPELPGDNLSNGLKVLSEDINSVRIKLRERHQTAYGDARLTIHTSTREKINQ